MRWYALALAAGVGLAPPAAGQEQRRAWPEITGSVRGGHWSSTRELDRLDPIGAAMGWIKGSASPSRHTTLFVEGWGALRGPPDDGNATLELREGFASVSAGALDLRLGRQVLAWGRADGVNPTGNLAAEDMTLLTPEDADRRLGATSLVATYYAGGVSLSAVWLPEFRGHRIALPSQAGVSFARERIAWPGNQWALRVERSGGSIDWSTSLFHGLDLSPDLSPTVQAGTVALRHHRVRVLGADAATTLGQFGVRAEGAYVRTADRDGSDPFTKNPFLFVVIGGDRTFDGRLNLNAQYLLRRVTHYNPPAAGSMPDSALARQQAILSSQNRRVQQGASIRTSYKWLHETLETEWAAIAYADPRGGVMRPKVTYALSDRYTVTGGAELFRGQSESLFHLLRPNSTVFLEVRWGF